MAEYEYLMEKRAADGSIEALATKQASKVKKSNPNDPDDLATLVKKQESFEKVLNAYKKNPSKESLQKVITHLKATAAKHPRHLNPGYYGAMFDAIDRAKEMMGRGNTLRGLATYGLAVPLESAWATLTAPETALARAMNKDRNVDSTSIEALSEADPSNIERNARAATELHDAYVSTREDPTKQVEGLMNEARRTVYTPGKGGWLAGARLPITLAMDALSAPHTALFNSKGWNGKSRKEWEAEQEKSAAYDALMEKHASLQKKADLSSQATKGLIGAGIGSLIGGGAGYLTGEDENTAKGIKGTKLRNALIGGILGAAGGGGIGAALGKSDDVRHSASMDDSWLKHSIRDDLDKANRATRQQFKAQDEKIKQGLGKHDDLIDALAFVSLKGDDESFSPGHISTYGQKKLRQSIPTLVERLIPYSKKLQGDSKLPQDMRRKLDNGLDAMLGANKY